VVPEKPGVRAFPGHQPGILCAGRSSSFCYAATIGGFDDTAVSLVQKLDNHALDIVEMLGVAPLAAT
jgi:hypothetical protein